MRPSGQRRSARARWASLSTAEARRSSSSSTRESVVLTDWPPGPGDFEKRSTSSPDGTTRPSGRPGPAGTWRSRITPLWDVAGAVRPLPRSREWKRAGSTAVVTP